MLSGSKLLIATAVVVNILSVVGVVLTNKYIVETDGGCILCVFDFFLF